MLSPGTKLGGRYRLDERIAGGGMGDVWRGTDEVLGRTVAIKVMLPALVEEPGFAERFRGEARTMATINHSGVVDVYDYASEAGTAFLIMEYVEGESLAQILSRVNRLTPARTMSLIEQAAEALQAAHAMGIVHRDVKPGNFLVRPNGTLVLTDFGIARSAQAAQLTAVGSVLGTASYLSPEQAAGEPATALSDIYSLGIVAYQCLSGHRPFEGENPIEIALRHLRDAPPPLPPDVPPIARQLVDRAMAKDPATRWPSASALAEAARQAGAQLSGGGTGAIATSSLPPSQAPTAVVGTRPRPGMPPAGPGGLGMPPAGPGGPGMPPGATRRMGAVPPSPTSPGSPPGGTRAMPVSPAAAGRHPVTPYPPTSSTPARPAAPDRSGFGGGGSPARRAADGRRQQMVLMTALATFLCLVVGAGGIYLISQYHNSSGDGEGPSVPSSQPVESVTAPRSTQTPSRTANKTKPDSNLVSVDCEYLRGRKKDDVESSLKSLGLKTRTESVPATASQKTNQVVGLHPCGEVKEGTEITLEVATGKTQGSTSPNARPSSCLDIGNNLVCPSSGS